MTRLAAAALVATCLVTTPAAAAREATTTQPDPLHTLALVLALAAAIVPVRRTLRERPGWSTRQDGRVDTQNLSARRQLDALRDHDPDFSPVLLESFLAHLYTRAHTARGAPEQRPAIRPYLRDFALADLLALGEHPVTGILVGALQIRESMRIRQRWHIVVDITARRLEAERELFTRERWTLTRRIALRSRPPERVHSLGCPNCGAPPRAIHGQTCDDCDQPVDSGEFDWIVEHITTVPTLAAPAPTPPPTTAAPHTIYDPYARVAWKLLLRKDPTFSADQLSQRTAAIFTAVHAPGSDMPSRVTDTVADAHRYRLAFERAAGHHRTVDSARITNLEIVRCTSDRWFDAITVRIHATGLDCTRDAAGTIVAGSDTHDRTWSDYWTLLRDRAVERDDAVCPHCAAPLSLLPGGECSHCHAHLTTPAPDWILARSEPDATYHG